MVDGTLLLFIERLQARLYLCGKDDVIHNSTNVHWYKVSIFSQYPIG